MDLSVGSAAIFKGTWCSGTTSALHAEGIVHSPQCVHSITSVLEWNGCGAL